jgi:hypothetical protein
MNPTTRNPNLHAQTLLDYIIVIAIVAAATFFIVTRFKDSIESLLAQPTTSQNQPLQPF